MSLNLISWICFYSCFCLCYCTFIICHYYCYCYMGFHCHTIVYFFYQPTTILFLFLMGVFQFLLFSHALDENVNFYTVRDDVINSNWCEQLFLIWLICKIWYFAHHNTTCCYRVYDIVEIILPLSWFSVDCCQLSVTKKVNCLWLVISCHSTQNVNKGNQLCLILATPVFHMDYIWNSCVTKKWCQILKVSQLVLSSSYQSDQTSETLLWLQYHMLIPTKIAQIKNYSSGSNTKTITNKKFDHFAISIFNCILISMNMCKFVLKCIIYCYSV